MNVKNDNIQLIQTNEHQMNSNVQKFEIKPVWIHVFRSTFLIVIPVPFIFGLSGLTLAPLNLHYPMYILISLSLINCLCTLYYCAFSDPGIQRGIQYYHNLNINKSNIINYKYVELLTMVPDNLQLEIIQLDHAIDFKYCHHCMQYKPVRCSHSTKNHICVNNFDHYCKWIGQVVGRRNHYFFFYFLQCLLSYIFIVIIFQLITIGVNIYQIVQCPNINKDHCSITPILKIHISVGVQISSLTINILFLGLSGYFLYFICYLYNGQQILIITNTMNREYLDDNFHNVVSLKFSQFNYYKHMETLKMNAKLERTLEKKRKLYQALIQDQNFNLLNKIEQNQLSQEIFQFLQCILYVKQNPMTKTKSKDLQQMFQELQTKGSVQFLIYDAVDELTDRHLQFTLQHALYLAFLRYFMKKADEIVHDDDCLLWNQMIDNFLNMAISVRQIINTKRQCIQFVAQNEELFTSTIINAYLSCRVLFHRLRRDKREYLKQKKFQQNYLVENDVEQLYMHNVSQAQLRSDV